MSEENRRTTVRFAPSPTGSLHIGGARTALFNYLWAKHNDGKFLLRFEDTDSTRSDRIYEESILADLLWLGIKPDGEVIRQSSRIERHMSVLAELKSKGVVYPCFCDIPHKAEDASPPLSDPCRSLSISEAAERIERSENACWRFAIPSGIDSVIFSDTLRGEISIKTQSIGDFVVARSDGTPTYLFAVVVDDHDSSVTHAIRGDEHLSNTPKQKLIYDAMCWKEPAWVHIPMILDMDRRKLGKRSGAVSISQYRCEGWDPAAIVAYLATLSWSGSITDRLPAMHELAERFDLKSVALFSPVHDEARMRHFGRLAMEALSPEKVAGEYEYLFPAENVLEDRVSLVRELAASCSTLLELQEGLEAVLAEPKPVSLEKGAIVWLEDMLGSLSGIEESGWNSQTIKETIREFQKRSGLKGKDLYHTLRLVVTGSDSGPPIPLIISCIGRKNALGRIEDTIISRQNGGI